MLPLESPKWEDLSYTIIFEDCANLPDSIRKWQAALGTPQEQEVYLQFREMFFYATDHTNAAFAVAPYIVQALDEKRTCKELNFLYVEDLGFIEGNRLYPAWQPGATEEWKNYQLTPPLPDDLKQDYLNAVQRARVHAAALLNDKNLDGNQFHCWRVPIVNATAGAVKMG